MNNPVVLWIANLLGWDPAIIVILATVVVIFASYYFFIFLFSLYIFCKRNYEATEGFESFCWLLGAGVLLLVVGPIYILINILYIVALISFAHDIRDWWHKGAK